MRGTGNKYVYADNNPLSKVEEFQRRISVPAAESPTPMTEEDLKRCEAPGHMIYK